MRTRLESVLVAIAAAAAGAGIAFLVANKGLVFFGDMGGNFYALDAATGQKLWGQKIGGAIGGGVITYTAKGAQKVAVTTGYISPAFPAEIRRAKVAILGLEGDGTGQ